MPPLQADLLPLQPGHPPATIANQWLGIYALSGIIAPPFRGGTHHWIKKPAPRSHGIQSRGSVFDMAMNASRTTAAADQTTAQVFAGGHHRVNRANKSMIPDKKLKTTHINRRNPVPADACGFQSFKATAARRSKKVIVRVSGGISLPIVGANHTDESAAGDVSAGPISPDETQPRSLAEMNNRLCLRGPPAWCRSVTRMPWRQVSRRPTDRSRPLRVLFPGPPTEAHATRNSASPARNEDGRCSQLVDSWEKEFHR